MLDYFAMQKFLFLLPNFSAELSVQVDLAIDTNFRTLADKLQSLYSRYQTKMRVVEFPIHAQIFSISTYLKYK